MDIWMYENWRENLAIVRCLPIAGQQIQSFKLAVVIDKSKFINIRPLGTVNVRTKFNGK